MRVFDLEKNLFVFKMKNATKYRKMIINGILNYITSMSTNT